MVKRLHSLTAVICVLSLLLFLPAPAWAQAQESPAATGHDVAYNNDLSNLQFATRVYAQKEEDCVYYALVSAAGSYCLKYQEALGFLDHYSYYYDQLGLSDSFADFSVKKLEKEMGALSKNFGSILYGAVRHDLSILGEGFYITGIESLTGRDEWLLKQRIVENGAVMAALSLPEDAENMMDAKHYSACAYHRGAPEDQKEYAFYLGFSSPDPARNHAVTLVGWDDQILIQDENNTVDCRGAWLCKNSYGTQFGDGGYFWLPYNYPFLYAAALELSCCPGVTAVRSGAAPFLLPRRLSGVGFRSGAIQNAMITVEANGKTCLELKTDLGSGYHYFPLDAPVRANCAAVMINGVPLQRSQINCYFAQRGSRLPSAPTARNSSWAQPLSKLNITVSGGEPKATTNQGGRVIDHHIALARTNNRHLIRPADGWYFDDEMKISYASDTYAYAPGDPGWKFPRYFDLPLQPEPYVSSTGEFPSDPYLWKEADGTVVSLYDGVGSGFVDGLELTTDDESGALTAVKKRYDEGQTEEISARLLYGGLPAEDYALDNRGAQITADALPERGAYYAVLTLEEPVDLAAFSVTLNGAATGYEISKNPDGSLTVGVVIEIPDVAINLLQLAMSIIARLIGLLSQ